MSGEDEVPYIEEPDELDDDHESNGLICFLDPERVCGADCMAYTTMPSESPYLNDQQKHCMLIVSAERLSRYAGGALSLMRNSKADTARKGTPPPDPMGKSR